ncbi:MAG TPA: hypothetical protein PLF32_02300 [Bacteroidales bacterium]|nr:hypothetical protein [Bacteroidales bacterium]HOR81472.1 hypothetical protein [Bacteroidales bacterium]HPJ90647.1 hypothetical protein [Bacteroidales bacterium]
MKRSLILLLYLLILYSCKTVYNKNNICGTYINFPYDDTTEILNKLVLFNNGTFAYYSNEKNVEYLGHYKLELPYCHSPIGKWVIKNNKVILNTKINELTIETIKQERENKDSFKIQFLNLSDSSIKKEDTIEIFTSTDGNKTFKYFTDQNGYISLSRKDVKYLLIHDGLLGRKHKIPKRGYDYKIYYVDCFYNSFNNKTLIIYNDSTLIEREIVKNHENEVFIVEWNYYKENGKPFNTYKKMREIYKKQKGNVSTK